MAVYCVSYDLKGPNPDYEPLIEALQSEGKWWHFLESTWLVSTDETSSELYKRLLPALTRKDCILIIEVPNNAQGWLPREAWDWIRNNVPEP